MYLPAHFSDDDPATALALVRAAGFGHLVVSGEHGLASTPMPFLVDDELTAVRAHLARPNPLWRSAPCDALVIVPVDDAYVSPNWYPSKAEHGEVVPTWNYEVVHLHGRLVVHDDAEWIRRQVGELTDLHEAPFAEPWEVTDAPDHYVDRMLRAIVGIEIEIGAVRAKRKLSQNRPADDRAAVRRELAGRDPRSAAVASSMEAG